MREAVLGLDIGTTSTKAVLFDLLGTELAAAERAYPLQTPQPGWVEQNPGDLWGAVIAAIRDVVKLHGSNKQILALALAAQSGSLIPAAADGTPVYPAIIWMDGRTEDIVNKWRAAGLEERIKRISGWSLTAGLGLPTITWLRQFKPDVFAAAQHFFSVNDFLVHRLTGKFCMNPSNGNGLQLIDIRTGQWHEELCVLAGIKMEQLSPIRPSGEIIGKLTPEAARLTGLSTQTMVINGGHDQSGTALGIGVTKPGEALLACGTAWVVTTVVDEPDVEKTPPGINISFHDLPRRWTASQSLGGLGASLEWLVNRFWGADGKAVSRSEKYAALNKELETNNPPSGGSDLFFLPLTGGHHAPAGRQQGGFVGLSLGHDRADMAYAVMEGGAFELRWALEDMKRSGMKIEHLWMVGGAAQSATWPQVIANATGLPLGLPQYKSWPALGAALLAGVGLGLLESIETGQARFQKPVQHIEKDDDLAATADQRFKSYRQIFDHWRAYCL